MELCVQQGASRALQELARMLNLSLEELLDRLLGPQRLADLEFIEAMEDLAQRSGVELCIEPLKSGG